ncbi:Protein of unknown function [Cotesia congregata]|uniref:Endonuclease/exonuclease/phosphatase domain-containing protein n=1 Tax=Cotesia congregata TaxID=51543 RepID=A0A8J2MQ27_COTCN|nr:Protein of unknown function [Cotesia congregata]
MNLQVNADSISKLDEELTEMKTKMVTNKQSIEEKLSNLENSISANRATATTMLPATRSAAELIISGIPDPIIDKLSHVDISILSHLNLPHSTNDILSSRKLENKTKSNTHKTGNEDSPNLHLFLRKYLSQRILTTGNLQITAYHQGKVPDHEVQVIRRGRILKHADIGNYIRGGGEACLIHNSLRVKVLHISASNHLNQPEFLIVDVTLRNSCHLLLSCIYRRLKGMLLTEFFNVHSKLAPNYKNIIIAGDLNCNLLENSYTANHLKDFIIEFSLHCISYNATFHKNDCDSWLDVILIDIATKFVSFAKSDSSFTDGHDYLLCQYKVDQLQQIKILKTDQQVLATSLFNSLTLDNSIVENLDPNDLTIFKSNVLSTLDLHAPVLTKSITQLTFARESYLKSALSSLPYGSTVWSKLRNLGLTKSNSSSPLNFFDARELNEYYANIVRKHATTSKEFLNSLPTCYQRQVESSFHWQKIDVDVTKVLQSTLSKSKGKSPDGLDLRWLRDYIRQINFSLLPCSTDLLTTALTPNFNSKFVFSGKKYVGKHMSHTQHRPLSFFVDLCNLLQVWTVC